MFAISTKRNNKNTFYLCQTLKDYVILINKKGIIHLINVKTCQAFQECASQCYRKD